MSCKAEVVVLARCTPGGPESDSSVGLTKGARKGLWREIQEWVLQEVFRVCRSTDAIEGVRGVGIVKIEVAGRGKALQERCEHRRVFVFVV